MWKMKRGNVTGYSGQAIMMLKDLINGLFMDFFREKIMNYTELQVTTNFSFLRGASHPEELVEQAALLGYKEIGITDRNSFAGIVRAHTAAKGWNEFT